MFSTAPSRPLRTHPPVLGVTTPLGVPLKDPSLESNGSAMLSNLPSLGSKKRQSQPTGLVEISTSPPPLVASPVIAELPKIKAPRSPEQRPRPPRDTTPIVVNGIPINPEIIPPIQMSSEISKVTAPMRELNSESSADSLGNLTHTQPVSPQPTDNSKVIASPGLKVARTGRGRKREGALPLVYPEALLSPQQPATQVAQPQQQVTQAASPQQPATQVAQPQQPATQATQPQQQATQVAQPQQSATQAAPSQQPATQVAQPQQPATQVAQPQQPATQVAQPQQPASQAVSYQQPIFSQGVSYQQPIFSQAMSPQQPTSYQQSVSQPVSPQQHTSYQQHGIFTPYQPYYNPSVNQAAETQAKSTENTSIAKPIINTAKIPSYAAFSATEKAQFRAKFRLEFEKIRKILKGHEVPAMSETDSLEQVHAVYDVYRRQTLAYNDANKYMLWIQIGWVALEVVCVKWLFDSSMTGLATTMGKMRGHYMPILMEIGENNHKVIDADGAATRWSPETRLLLTTLGSAAIFILLKLLVKWLFGREANPNQVIDWFSSYVAGNQAAAPAGVSAGPTPVDVQEDGPDLSSLASTAASVMGFGGGGGALGGVLGGVMQSVLGGGRVAPQQHQPMTAAGPIFDE